MAAHITAAAVGAPRYNSKLTPEQRRHFDNGIWMCGHHGTLVDRDHTRYSVDQLRKWKRKAEAIAQKEHEGVARHTPMRPQTHVQVKVTAPALDVYPPRITFYRPAGAPLFDGPGGPYQYFVAELWFRNEPLKGGPVAKTLTAFLEFSDANGTPLFSEIRGEWAIANAGDNVGFTSTQETLADLPPVGEIAKLLVLQKRIEAPIAYAWSRGAREYPGRRHVSHQIPPGEYQLRVRIRGLHVDETFYFRFTNPGAGADPVVQGLNGSEGQ
ncbi:MAG: hypothetical protein DMF90_23785 [Acidobacteria bacterium]|nr:MAG: hypothetical protein DMF90_23785 [Acidobacteriota bacterium]